MRLTKVVHLRVGGRVTLPAEFRSQLKIDEHTLLKITLVGRELRVRPVQITPKDKGSAWARELYVRFAPVRKETTQYGEKEIDADIDQALTAIRGKRRSRRSGKQ